MRLTLLSLFLLLVVFRPTDCGADRPWERVSARAVTQAADYPPVVTYMDSYQRGWEAPPGYVLWSPGPVGAALLVPETFARGAEAILECESRQDSWAAVGDKGLAYGGFQVRRDAHEAAMKRGGLDFWQEEDRIRWAVHLWESSGRTWSHWSCSVK